jgi:methyl-accepting chemotaxis protein WspA
MFSRQLSFRMRMALLVSVFLGGLAVTHFMYIEMIRSVRIHSPNYERIISDKDLIANVLPPPQYIIGSYLKVFQIMDAKDEAEREEFIEGFRKLRKEYDNCHKEWDERLEAGDLRDKLIGDSYDAAILFYDAVEKELIEPLKSNTPAAELRSVLDETVEGYYQQHRMAIEEVVRLAKVRIEEDEKLAEDTSRFWRIAQIVVGAFVLALLLWISWVIMRVMKQTQDLIEQVQRSTVQLNSTATEIAAAAGEQNSTMQGFNASTSEIAASVKQISATGLELMGTVEGVHGRANETSGLAGSGQESLTAMASTMGQLSDATGSISSKLGMIREKAGGINTVVETITKVADQTNLLSINAAIEAEKAGEAGRGFLVVSREIRRLADQTAVATLDIEQMVRQMQDSVSAGVMEMDKFSEQVRTCTDQVAEIGGQMSEIIGQVQLLSDEFQMVNDGMRQQSQGARQIDEAMAQLATGVHQVSSSVKDFNSAAESLRHSAGELQEEVNSFEVAG